MAAISTVRERNQAQLQVIKDNVEIQRVGIEKRLPFESILVAFNLIKATPLSEREIVVITKRNSFFEKFVFALKVLLGKIDTNFFEIRQVKKECKEKSGSDVVLRLSEDLERASVAIQEARKDAHQLDQERQSLEEENKLLKHDLQLGNILGESLSKMNEKLISEKEQLNEDLETVKAANAKLEEEKGALEEQIKSLEAGAEKSVKLNQELRIENSELHNDLQQALDTIAKAKKENADVTAALESPAKEA